MNEEDVFRKLGSGLKFDKNNVINDAHRFLTRPSKPFEIADIKSSVELDFFRRKLSNRPNCEEINKKRKLSKEENRKKSFLIQNSLKDVEKILETKKTDRLESGDSLTKENFEILSQIEKSHKKEKARAPRNFRKLHKIFVEGSDIPEVVTTFHQLQSTFNFDQTCLKNVIENMGFHTLTPIQMQAIPAMLHGREILACAPTGSGKTLAFLIPVVHYLLTNKKHEENSKKGFRGLILSPTKELAEQTYRECKILVSQQKEDNMPTKPLIQVKLLDKNEAKVYFQSGSIRSNKTDLLITTPNRLISLLQHDPPLISLDFVEWLVVDESDKLFEKGDIKESFRDQLGRIYSACTNSRIKRAMFSATFAYDVQQWCIMNMDNVLQVTVGGKNTAVETVQQELKYVGNEHGKLLAMKEIFVHGFLPPILVFVQSKERAKELFTELLYEGKKVDAIHSDRTPTERENSIKGFRRGDTWILVCTELLGRGMDFKGINLVINYDFPTSAISYIHRIGRTGRAGRPGKAVTFFTDEDKPLLKSIANVIRQAGCAVPEYILKFKKTSKEDLKRLAKSEIKRSAIRIVGTTSPKKRRKLHHKKINSEKDAAKGNNKLQREKSSFRKTGKSAKDAAKKFKSVRNKKSQMKKKVRSKKPESKKSKKIQKRKTQSNRTIQKSAVAE